MWRLIVRRSLRLMVMVARWRRYRLFGVVVLMIGRIMGRLMWWFARRMRVGLSLLVLIVLMVRVRRLVTSSFVVGLRRRRSTLLILLVSRFCVLWSRMFLRVKRSFLLGVRVRILVFTRLLSVVRVVFGFPWA